MIPRALSVVNNINQLENKRAFESEKSASRIDSRSKHARAFGSPKALVIFALSLYGACFLWQRIGHHAHKHHTRVFKEEKALCSQIPALRPLKHAELWDDLGKLISADGFALRAADWLGEAVRVPTPSFDEMGPVGKDERWEVFGELHAYLVRAFPKTHTNLKLTKVNTYGLIYEWSGSDTQLKPLILAAHQDVVPVDEQTLDQWDYPPFSGFFDGARIWGRGSADDKNGLVGIMSTVEILLEQKFQPTRSIVLAFGFDEEASGLEGAHNIAATLLSLYGPNEFAMLVDEGGGFSAQFGGVVAVPGVTEKGYLDMRVEVNSPGGHSSIPPVHTSIGILASLLVYFEDHPYSAHLGRSTPVYQMVQCFAENSPEMDDKLRHTIIDSRKSDKALAKVEALLLQDNTLRSLAGTTQAIDLIKGGVKTNALPEQAWAVVNHRISTDSSVAEVMDRDTTLLEPLAKKFNLSYTAFGKRISTFDDTLSSGRLTLSDAWQNGLEPAPVAPYTGSNAAPYDLLSGTIRATYNAHRSNQIHSTTEKNEVVVAPGIMSGNTDTQYYWNLTQHIFRYNHLNEGDGATLGNIHTVNEYIELDAFLEQIRFFSTLILNADESTGL